MVKSITLTASMRSNLNSLKNISKQMSSTQERLSTGKKVNSAIDNASSYYQARALTNRASDLDALLDAMGQGIQTIQAATQGLTSGVSFLEQASAIATEALAATKIPSKEWFETQENVAAVASNWAELKAALDSGVQGNIVIYGNIQAEGQINLKAGQNLVGVGYYGIEEPDTDKYSQLSIDLEKLNITDGIKAQADDLVISDISIRGVTRSSVSSYVVNLNGKSNITLNNLDLMMDNTQQVGYDEDRNVASRGIYLGNNTLITGNNFIYEKGKTENKQIISHGLSNGTNVQVKGNLNVYMLQSFSRGIQAAKIKFLENSELNIFAQARGLDSCNAEFLENSSLNMVLADGDGAIVYGELILGGKARVNMKTLRNFVATYNPLTVNVNSSDIQMNIESSKQLFWNENNQLTFNAVEGSKFSHNGKVYKTDTDVSDNTMKGDNLPLGFAEEVGETAPSLDFLDEMVNVLQAKAAQGIKGYQKETDVSSVTDYADQYNKAFEQYDRLVNDSSYQGVNLLKNEKLDVIFNETRNNKLTVQGRDMSSAALGLTKAEWTTQRDIANSIQELLAAVNKIRTFQSELGNNYSIIQTRQNFTEALTDVLETGADNLVLADMNEESANYLALQTRQQLATNALSLAANSAQSILAPFG
ncbi:MAG: flagellin [Alphaproteobacteria bacterium]|nr:flagellin [Alphaproteobacteria bacterium]